MRSLWGIPSNRARGHFRGARGGESGARRRALGAVKSAAGALLFIICGCTPTERTGTDARSIVWGEDDRYETHAYSDPKWRARMRASTVALFDADSLVPNRTGQFVPEGDTIGAIWGLCPGEAFADQPSASFCSGTLIAPDLVLTAGHCVAPDCDDTRFAFDYQYAAPGTLETIDADDVYHCREVLVHAHDGITDHAIVRLDRPVVGRAPVPVRTAAEPIPEGAATIVLGYPSGLPGKITDRAVVSDPRPQTLDYFQSDGDIFSGSSGAGTFNPVGEVVGIAVRGHRQGYEYDRERDCWITIRRDISLSALGEYGYAFRAIDALCAGPERDHALCAPRRGLCDHCQADAECRAGARCQKLPGASTRRACVPDCARTEDCPPGHTCGEAGHCVPASDQTRLACQDNTVVEVDLCARPLRTVTECSGTQSCVGTSRCVDRGPGDGCSDAVPLEAPVVVVTGDLQGYTAETELSCGADGPERFYAFELDEPTLLTARVESDVFDAVLGLRTADCATPLELYCSDDRIGRNPELTEHLPAGAYHLVVQSHRRLPAASEFQLSLSYEPATPTSCHLATEIEARSQVLSGSFLGQRPTPDSRSCGGESGPDRGYRFDVHQPTRFWAELRGTGEGPEEIDPILQLRAGGCEFTDEQACDDDSGPGRTARLEEQTLAPGRYFLIADSFAPNEGAFQLELFFEAIDPACPAGDCPDAGGPAPGDAGPTDSDAAAPPAMTPDAGGPDGSPGDHRDAGIDQSEPPDTDRLRQRPQTNSAAGCGCHGLRPRSAPTARFDALVRLGGLALLLGPMGRRRRRKRRA